MGKPVTIFLDANVVIYLVEGSAPLRKKVRATLSGLMRAHPGSKFAVARLSFLECLVKPMRDDDRPLVERYRRFFDSTDLLVVELTAEVVERATVLRASYPRLRTPDALQAACVLSLPAPCIFVTGDADFGKIPELECTIVSTG